MTTRRFETAIGFVDWNTALIASGATRCKRPDDAARTAIAHVEQVVSNYLGSARGPRYRVRLRLYAGWHEGTTRTDHYRGVSGIRLKYANKIRTYREGRVAFLGGDDGVQLGARLACASDRRLVRKHDVHLLDTLRHRDGKSTEKMVDTALVADLLGLAMRKEADRYVVVSDDDDMFPGLFAAEAAGAKIGMLRRPETISRFMTHAADFVATYESVEP